MRLIDVDTFALQEFAGAGAAPKYAILSHTWSNDEVSYQDIQNLETARQKVGFEKIQCTCEQAKIHGLQYAWVDTCCIDKSSSHELAESISSMFAWYQKAAVCYVYLVDVPGKCPRLEGDRLVLPSGLRWIVAFEESRWWTRGWTLQELIAPPHVLFFGEAWNFIGALADLVGRVSGITKIPLGVLDHSRPVSDFSVARRLSWSALRHTTRTEDHAYSLFGILEVNMPLLYGEGSQSFERLQEEIIRKSTDQSIFAWDALPNGSSELLLAPSPYCFLNCTRMRRLHGRAASESSFHMNNKGLEITLPIIRRRLHGLDSPCVTLGLLECQNEDSPDTIALVMTQHPFTTQNRVSAPEFYVSGYNNTVGNNNRPSRLMPVGAHDRDDAGTTTTATITRDLQTQSYAQTFRANPLSWFPLRFTGSEPARVPSLEAVHPEQSWHESSNTLRLRMPQSPSGGALVRLGDGRAILIGFGVIQTSSGYPSPSRRIHGLLCIDPRCQIQPHLQHLIRRKRPGGNEMASLRLGKQERIFAYLWHGALVVSVESWTVTKAVGSSSLVVRTSPVLSRSPTMPAGPSSFPGPLRRDSLLQDDRLNGLNDAQDDDTPAPQIHRSRTCEHCRSVEAHEQVERDRRRDEHRRRNSEEQVRRRDIERQRSRRATAATAASGFSLAGILADMTDVVEFL